MHSIHRRHRLPFKKRMSGFGTFCRQCFAIQCLRWTSGDWQLFCVVKFRGVVTVTLVFVVNLYANLGSIFFLLTLCLRLFSIHISRRIEYWWRKKNVWNISNFDTDLLFLFNMYYSAEMHLTRSNTHSLLRFSVHLTWLPSICLPIRSLKKAHRDAIFSAASHAHRQREDAKSDSETKKKSFECLLFSFTLFY